MEVKAETIGDCLRLYLRNIIDPETILCQKGIARIVFVQPHVLVGTITQPYTHHII